MNLKRKLTVEEIDALHLLYKFIERNELANICIDYLGGVKLFTETNEEYVSPIYLDMQKMGKTSSPEKTG